MRYLIEKLFVRMGEEIEVSDDDGKWYPATFRQYEGCDGILTMKNYVAWPYARRPAPLEQCSLCGGKKWPPIHLEKK